MAHVDVGLTMGCPYLAFDGHTPYVSYYHTFEAPSGIGYSAFHLRALDTSNQRRADVVFEMRRDWNNDATPAG